jgi:hypothetical protein
LRDDLDLGLVVGGSAWMVSSAALWTSLSASFAVSISMMGLTVFFRVLRLGFSDGPSVWVEVVAVVPLGLRAREGLEGWDWDWDWD